MAAVRAAVGLRGLSVYAARAADGVFTTARPMTGRKNGVAYGHAGR
jgi:hypothetical protein